MTPIRRGPLRPRSGAGDSEARVATWTVSWASTVGSRSGSTRSRTRGLTTTRCADRPEDARPLGDCGDAAVTPRLDTEHGLEVPLRGRDLEGDPAVPPGRQPGRQPPPDLGGRFGCGRRPLPDRLAGADDHRGRTLPPGGHRYQPPRRFRPLGRRSVESSRELARHRQPSRRSARSGARRRPSPRPGARSPSPAGPRRCLPAPHAVLRSAGALPGSTRICRSARGRVLRLL